MDTKRFKNYGLWVAIFSLIPMVINSLGIKIIPEDYEKITTTILTIFATLGILNNPTTECKWYRDENGNKILQDPNKNDEVINDKYIKEKSNNNVNNNYNKEIYDLICDLLKDKISNVSRIDNIEELLKDNLENLSSSRNINKDKLDYKSILREDTSILIQKNIEELLRENAERLVKENLEKFLKDNIAPEVLKDNIEDLTKEKEKIK